MDKRHWGLFKKVHKRHKGCRTKKREFKNKKANKGVGIGWTHMQDEHS